MFRGPSGQGTTSSDGLPITWGGAEERNVAWKSPLVGDGHASPIVLGDRIIVSTARWPEELESATERAAVMPEHHVVAYGADDGAKLWDTKVEPGPWLRSDFRSGAGGGYASTTPTTDGERIYAVFGSAVIAALSPDGDVVWREEIVPHTFDVTIGGSPVVFQDTVLFLCAMAKPDDSRLVAYDAKTGAVRWETPMPGTGFAHSTPLLIEVEEEPQLIVVASGIRETASGVQSFDPRTGERLWWCRGAGDAASAAFGDGIVYSDSGRGGPGVAIDPTGRGDVSETHVRWRLSNVPEGIGSPVIVGERVYRLRRPNVLECWRTSDGERVAAARLDGLSSTWISPIVDARGHLYFANGGTSYVVRAGDELEVLAKSDLGDANHASAAVYGDALIIVGMRHVYRIEERAGAAPDEDGEAGSSDREAGSSDREAGTDSSAGAAGAQRESAAPFFTRTSRT